MKRGCSDLAKNFCRELCVDGNIVERVSVFKLLGVTIDDTLKWKAHVNGFQSFTFLKISKA